MYSYFIHVHIPALDPPTRVGAWESLHILDSIGIVTVALNVPGIQSFHHTCGWIPIAGYNICQTLLWSYLNNALLWYNSKHIIWLVFTIQKLGVLCLRVNCKFTGIVTKINIISYSQLNSADNDYLQKLLLWKMEMRLIGKLTSGNLGDRDLALSK